MTSDISPRVAPGGLRELGPLNWLVWRVLSRAAGTPDAHLFSTLGRTRGLFIGWLHYSGKLMPGGRLPRHDSELVILRIAHLRGCGYEWDHHVRLGRKVGLTPEILEQVKQGPTAPEWSDHHRALMTAVDQLIHNRTVDNEQWDLLAKEYDERRMIEFTLLVAQYDGLATTIGVLGIPRDTF